MHFPSTLYSRRILQLLNRFLHPVSHFHKYTALSHTNQKHFGITMMRAMLLQVALALFGGLGIASAFLASSPLNISFRDSVEIIRNRSSGLSFSLWRGDARGLPLPSSVDRYQDQPPSPPKSGKVKWFNTKSGYGFISPEDGSADVFVHQTAIRTEGYRSLADGESVEYQSEVDGGGGVRAMDVTGPGGSDVKGAPFRPSSDFEGF